MSTKSAEQSNGRYERKFVVSQWTPYEVEVFVKSHPALFLEAFPPRSVNNLYLDSLDSDNYLASVNGSRDRMKVRIRWYGNLFGMIEKPVLELKIKSGAVNRKERYPVAPFSFNEGFSFATIADALKNSEMPDLLKLDLMTLELSLVNRYLRKYFQTGDRKYRITIDSKMEFYETQLRTNTFRHKSVDDRNTVLELKYSMEEEANIKSMLNYFPFRMAKSSKYVSGVERVHFG